MAISSAEVGAGVDTRVFDVTSTADVEGPLTIAHGLVGVSAGGAEVIVSLTPLKSNAYVAQWLVAVDATNITLTKAVTTASGVAGAQLRVTFQRRTALSR